MKITNIINEVIPKKPVAKAVTMATYWEENNVRYYLKKNEVFFRQEEINVNMNIARWFTEVSGRPVQLQPVVLNPKGIKTCDFILTDDMTKVELKTFNIKQFRENKNYIDMKLGEGYGQANDFIVDITDTEMTPEKAMKDIESSLQRENRRFVRRIYLKSNDTLIGIFERE